MKAFLALLRREYLEHRGAFVYAPLLLTGVLVLVIALALVSGNFHVWLNTGLTSSQKVFELAYVSAAALWWCYAFVAVFFYFADAFNADTRHNAMFFWKSMPQSDLKILFSKFTAGLTVLPALVFLAFLVTGIILAAAAFLVPLAVPLLGTPDIAATAAGWLDVSGVALCYLVLALLWYAPFFAWVGGLSTVFGRWSIPLALLVPVVVSLFEGVVDFGSAPGGSYVLSFLRSRVAFSFDTPALRAAFTSLAPIDAPELVQALLAGIDWLSLVGGLVFAMLVIGLASIYRRRVVKG